MKWTLKKLRDEIARLKAAWIAARKAKDDALTMKAFKSFRHYADQLEASEADGKTADTDEIEVKAEEVEQGKEVTLDEVATMLETKLKKSLTDLLPKDDSDKLTAEDVKQIVADALAKQFPVGTDGKAPKVTIEGIETMVQTVLETQVGKYRKDGKMVFDADKDGSKGHISRIEIPHSLRKGNLPLHMKQLLNVLLRKPQDEGIDSKTLNAGIDHDDSFYTRTKIEGAKALTAAGTGTGAEFVPRSLSAELQRRLYLASQISQAYLSREIEMPTDPYDLPLVTTNPVFYLNTTENTEGTVSDPGSANVTLTTKRMMAFVQYSYEAGEDAIIPLLPTIQKLLADAAARALENAIVNGDTTSTHQDSDVTLANDQAKAWKGFRKLSLAVSSLKVDISSGGVSRANLTALLKLLGKWGANTDDLLWVVGPKTWTALLGLDEFALAYARQGGSSTFSGGAPLQSPYGGTIARSEQARENLNASGVYDASTTTKGAINLVWMPGFYLGSRRGFTVETAKNIRSQTNDIVATFRKAFSPVETPAASTAQIVATAYNYTS